MLLNVDRGTCMLVPFFLLLIPGFSSIAARKYKIISQTGDTPNVPCMPVTVSTCAFTRVHKTIVTNTLLGRWIPPLPEANCEDIRTATTSCFMIRSDNKPCLMLKWMNAWWCIHDIMRVNQVFTKANHLTFKTHSSVFQLSTLISTPFKFIFSVRSSMIVASQVASYRWLSIFYTVTKLFSWSF